MKPALKALASLVALIAVVPASLMYQLGKCLIGAEKAFPGWSQALGLLPGISGVYLRRAFYRLVLPRCEGGVWIGFGTILSHPTAALGRNVYTGAYCCLGDVTLEDDVLLGSQVSIMNGGGQHGIDRLDTPIREQPGEFRRITVGRDSWIGERAVVMADIGEHCVVAAGAVVIRPLPDFAIAAGVPARILRYRNGKSAQPKSSPTEDYPCYARDENLPRSDDKD
jgi:acetyltransferase-like isoleucine patch superfamily enzyme